MDKIKEVTGISSFNEDILQSEFAKIIGSSEEVVQRLINTVVALWFLQREFEDKEDEWQLIAKKGRTFVKEQGYTGKLEILFKAIEQ